MAQQLINIGVADAKQGDNLFTGGTKINENFTELYASLQSGNNTVYLYSEDDLPNKTATTWTMDPNIPYKLAASFSTDLQGIPSAGSSLSGDNIGSYTLSFTGSGTSMFKGTDVDFYIHDIIIDPGVTDVGFEFNDTLGSVHRFIALRVAVTNCSILGKFTDMLLVQAENCNSGTGGNCLQGIQLFGTSGTILNINRFAFISSNTTFVGVDMGSSVLPIIEVDDMFMSAPPGAVGISGLTASANVPENRLARVSGCEFLGGMSDLSGITTDDIRWVFRDNTPTADTMPDALIHLSASGTTTIVSAGVYVKVNATWSIDTISQLSADTTGKVTWNGERDFKTPIDLSLSLAPSSGTNKTLRSRIAINGVTVPNSERSTRTDSGDASSITTPWQLTLSSSDYIEAFVTSDDATDVVTSSGIIRVN